MNKSNFSTLTTMEQVVAQNPRLDLRNFREWQNKQAELEAAGIDTNPPREPSKPKRQQPIPLSFLHL